MDISLKEKCKKKGIDTEVIEVVVQSSFEEALKELKKKVNCDGILRELKLKSFFESHNQRRKRKGAASRRRIAKQTRRNQ
jgi:ribosomal protein S21